MLELRPYQVEAVQAIMDHDYSTGNPLVVLPTGTGKSLVIADFAKRVASSARILVCTHSKDIVQQNHDEFADLKTGIRTGIYSAGLGKRQTKAQITFCGIQSVHRRAAEIGHIDILIADEAHAIPRTGNTMWRKFIEALCVINPDLVVIGLTATPFRLDSGLITEGIDAIFNQVIYEYGILRAINEGFLCSPTTPNMTTRFDLSGVKTLGGEYQQGELQKVMLRDADKTEAALDEVFLHGANRNCWLVFCAGVDHANEIAWRISRRGLPAKAITNETPIMQRDAIMSDFKAGRLRCVTNMKVMTTGTNVPRIDMIVDLMATKSAGLHVQKIGRGLRLFEGKSDCLVLDFVRNTDRHGPLDKIRGKSKSRKGDGDAPVKVCPTCHAINFAGVRQCVDCGHEFPPPEMDFETKASDAPILSTHEVTEKWLIVDKVRYARHRKEGAQYDTMKVTYLCKGEKPIYEFVCFDHPVGSYSWGKAKDWYNKNVGGIAPSSVEGALKEAWPKPSRIQVYKNGKYWNVKNHDFGEKDIDTQ